MRQLPYDWTKKELKYEINLRKERIDAIKAEINDRLCEIAALERRLAIIKKDVEE